MILGSDWGCGKTVVISGLAAALEANGFRVQAYKPLSFSSSKNPLSCPDQAFINAVTRQFIQVEPMYVPSPESVQAPLWNKLLNDCHNFPYPCLFEGVGQVATPWQVVQDELRDGIDVAIQLRLPVVLVSRAGTTFLEKSRAAVQFAKARDVEIIGVIRVETSPDLGFLLTDDAESLLLTHLTEVPFLGHLPYSPSISVPGLKQGNLLRMIEENIDLLPFQRVIGVRL